MTEPTNESELFDIIALHDGTILTNVHSANSCDLEYCCIHNPSDHPLRNAPLTWMGPPIRTMGRVCAHGKYHPDPDDLAFKTATLDWIATEAIMSAHMVVENCDGCCREGVDQS